jgi:hypothetical protein
LVAVVVVVAMVLIAVVVVLMNDGGDGDGDDALHGIKQQQAESASSNCKKVGPQAKQSKQVHEYCQKSIQAKHVKPCKPEEG